MSHAAADGELESTVVVDSVLIHDALVAHVHRSAAGRDDDRKRRRLKRWTRQDDFDQPVKSGCIMCCC